jgi:hypothetical protein
MFRHSSKSPLPKFELPNYGRSPIDDAALPQVTYNVNLRRSLAKKGKILDFDTTRYAQYLTDRGLTDDEIRQSTLNFSYARRLASLRGHYCAGRTVTGRREKPDMNRMTVYVKPTTNEKVADALVAHESEHRVQDTRGQLTRLALLRVAVREGFEVWGYGFSGLGMLLMTNYVSNPSAANASPKEATIALLAGSACTLGSVLDYRYSRIEREAFSTMPHALPLVSIEPDPNDLVYERSLDQLYQTSAFTNFGSE